ncbi:MAG: hypothetical protein KC488_06025, partial [Candidatus Cloacimonetes bacterium]|nr:hypothetical protein [Candidatus Cloacimonadota bacterium]
MSALVPVFVILMLFLDPLPIGHVISNGVFAILGIIFVFELLRGMESLHFNAIVILFALTIIGHLL